MFDVHVWDTPVSSLVVVTAAPTPTCSGFGLNVNALIEIAPGAGGGGGGAVVVVGADVVGGGVGAVSGGAVSAGAVCDGPGVGTTVATAPDDAPGAAGAAAIGVVVVVVSIVVVVFGGAALLPVLTAECGLLLAALTFLWESPPQAPNPRAATTTSAVTCRMVDVPTFAMYGRMARRDCQGFVQFSNR